MTIQQMRAAVYDVYSGNGWGQKVDNMSDIQVQAVYFSLLERGMIGEPKPTKVQTKPEPKKDPNQPSFEPFIGKQMSMF